MYSNRDKKNEETIMIHQEIEDDTTTEEEEEGGDEMEVEEEVPLFHDAPLASQKWNNRICSYYFKSIRDIAPYLSTWAFNRNIDEVHKNEIKATLAGSKHPHLMGTLQCVRDRQHQIRVINGQHRLQALWELLKEDLEMTQDEDLPNEIDSY